MEAPAEGTLSGGRSSLKTDLSHTAAKIMHPTLRFGQPWALRTVLPGRACLRAGLSLPRAERVGEGGAEQAATHL